MYRITVQALGGNEFDIYFPGDRDYVLTNAVLNYDAGLAGEFNFTIPYDNPAYEKIVQNSIITIYKDNVEHWRGDIRDIKTTFNKSLEVYCLEDLSWLGDEPLAMTQVTDQTNMQRFTSAINTYNSNQVAKRQFTVGQLTAVSTSGLCSWVPEYGMSILDGLRQFIAGSNGYLKVRRVTQNGVVTRYIDIITLADYGKMSNQNIEFGSNLLDYAKVLDATNIVNALYPYGAETETELYGDIMQRIAGTPIQNDTSIGAYGRRAKSVVFDTDDLTTLNNLASAYLSRYSQPHIELEITAVDLGSISAVDEFAIGDSVRVLAPAYAIDQRLYITNMSVDLLNPAANQIKLTDVVRSVSLTSQVQNQATEIKDIRSPLSVLDEAKRNAMSILQGDNGGIVTFEVNGQEQIVGILIANNLDIEQATKAWGWNINGLCYVHRDYPTDNWTLGIAMTMNGEIVADYITTGSLSAYRIAGGILEIGGTDYSDKAYIEIKDSMGNTACILDKDGLTMYKGLIQDAGGSNYWDVSGSRMKLLPSNYMHDDNFDYDDSYRPTNDNYPANTWTTEDEKRIHVGNTFYDTSMSIPYVYSVYIKPIIESDHPNKHDIDEYYVFETGLTSVKIVFDSECELETNADYLDIYYFANDTRSYFKKRMTGSFGNQEVYIKESKFWLHFHTDNSISRWGWKIDSIEVGDGTSSSGFYYESSLPSADWVSGISAKSYEWIEATIENYIQTATNQLLAENFTSAEIFDLLTNGGKIQGLFMQNGQVYFNAEYIGAGAIRIGGSAYQSLPELIIKDTTDIEIGRWDKDGISAEKGQFGGLKIYESGKLYLGSSYSSGARTTLRNGELCLRSPQSANDRQNTITDDGFELSPDLQSSTYDYLKVSISDGYSIKRRISGTVYETRWQSASDKRLKEDITSIDAELSKAIIDSAEPVRFKYKNTDGIHYGMLAQDVRKTLDDLGETDAKLEFSQGEMNGLDDQRALNYEEYIPLLIGYVKYLRKEIEMLKNTIKEEN